MSSFLIVFVFLAAAAASLPSTRPPHVYNECEWILPIWSYLPADKYFPSTIRDDHLFNFTFPEHLFVCFLFLFCCWHYIGGLRLKFTFSFPSLSVFSMAACTDNWLVNARFAILMMGDRRISLIARPARPLWLIPKYLTSSLTTRSSF